MALLDRRKASVDADTMHPVAPASAAGEPSPSEAWMQERTRVAVGRGVTVAGKLIFNEPVRIEGHFRGEVVSADLVVIADEATVEGRVQARKLVVMGELRGDITSSRRVYIGPRARVFGSITAENLTVCEGAYFDGRVRMTGQG
jgi:cytoskeletal protein CcmA (bactofilin family)